MFDMLKIKLIATLRSFQHACLTPVMRDDDETTVISPRRAARTMISEA